VLQYLPAVHSNGNGMDFEVMYEKLSILYCTVSLNSEKVMHLENVPSQNVLYLHRKSNDNVMKTGV
jgi:hypothetical protein